MSARIIDGVALAKTIRAEVAAEVGEADGQRAEARTRGRAGGRGSGQRGVRALQGQGVRGGRHALGDDPPAGRTSEAELLATVDRLNADPAIHGILVQLPLPKHINSEKVLHRIDPAKDVDGFHPVNVGKLVTGDKTAFRPATPYGVQQMLIRSGIETKGANAVIVGRSNIVGKPMANLLIQQGPGGDATVTVCHSRTRDLPAVTRTADILIAAIGKPEFVTARHGAARRGGDRRGDQPGGRRVAAQGLPADRATWRTARWPRWRRRSPRCRAAWDR